MRRCFALALLVVIPFSGLRVICVDGPAKAAAAAAHSESSAECDRLCVIHRPASSGDGTNCSLSADASSLLVLAGVAVVPATRGLGAPIVALFTRSEAPQLYLEPVLPHRNPPPKV